MALALSVGVCATLMAETVEQQAEKLAAMPRASTGNPFARVKNAEFNIEDRKEREAMMAAVHDCYEGKFGKYKDPQPQAKKEIFKYLDQPGRIAVNILRLFVDTLAVNYDETPTRIFYKDEKRVDEDDSDDGKIVAALNRHMQAADYDRFMGMLDRWMRLFGNVVARPIWDAEEKKLALHAYPSYCVRVVENKLNPRAPKATILLGFREELDGETTRMVPVAEVWMSEAMHEFDDGKRTATHSYGDSTINYTFNPLVHCFESPPFGGKGMYFVNSLGWQLAQQNVRLNEDYISQYIYAVLMQAIGILVVKGDCGELTIGPGSAVHFPNSEDQSGLDSVAQHADLSAFRDAIEFMLDVLRETYGIPKSMLQAEVSSSGQAIIQASAPLAELRAARQPMFDIIENGLVRSMLQELRGRADDVPLTVEPDQWSVALQYADIRANVSVNDEIAKDKHLVDMGVLTEAEILMREKPGQFDTLEDAQEWLDARAKRKRETAVDPDEEDPEQAGEQSPGEVIENQMEEE